MSAPPIPSETTSLVRHVTAEPGDAGERLDRLLAARLAELSRTRVKHLVEDGRVTLDGAAVTDPSLRVKAGPALHARLCPKRSPTRRCAQAMDLDIVYEDAHLLVLDKPAGLVVHPAPGNPDGTLVNALLAHCGASLAGIGGVRRPGIVHRLDKDTSGLMVVAKTEAAHIRALGATSPHGASTRAYEARGLGRAAAARRRDRRQHRPQPAQPQEDGGRLRGWRQDRR